MEIRGFSHLNFLTLTSMMCLIMATLTRQGLALETLGDCDSVSLDRVKRFTLFPQYTLLQISMAVVLPIEVPKRKVGLNVGLQVNFNLPYTPKEFYKPPYWDTRALKKERGDGKEEEKETGRRSERSLAYSCREPSPDALPFGDLPSEDFYPMVQHYLELQDFGGDCLEKAICEMSKHPLEHQHDNLLTELLHFLFSPSQHAEALQGSNKNAHLYAAERTGRAQGDCQTIYRCRKSPLEHLTELREEGDGDEILHATLDDFLLPQRSPRCQRLVQQLILLSAALLSMSVWLVDTEITVLLLKHIVKPPRTVAVVSQRIICECLVTAKLLILNIIVCKYDTFESPSVSSPPVVRARDTSRAEPIPAVANLFALNVIPLEDFLLEVFENTELGRSGYLLVNPIRESSMSILRTFQEFTAGNHHRQKRLYSRGGAKDDLETLPEKVAYQSPNGRRSHSMDCIQRFRKFVARGGESDEMSC